MEGFSSHVLLQQTKGAIHSTKISGNFGPKLNGSVLSNRKSFEKTGPPVGPVGIFVEWIAPRENELLS